MTKCLPIIIHTKYFVHHLLLQCTTIECDLLIIIQHVGILHDVCQIHSHKKPSINLHCRNIAAIVVIGAMSVIGGLHQCNCKSYHSIVQKCIDIIIIARIAIVRLPN